MPKGGLRSTSWNKGESGNIAGRPKRPEAIEAKKIVADVKAAAREHTQDALDTLKAVMSDAKAPPAARVSAATAMLDRGWGRAKETVDANVGVTLEALLLARISRRKDQPVAFDLGLISILRVSLRENPRPACGRHVSDM